MCRRAGPLLRPRPVPASVGDTAAKSHGERSQPTESLGTGHGRREYNPVQYTDFRKRSNRPDEVVSLWYDSYQNLAAAGIIPRGLAWRGQPQAFPNGGFVPDPRW